MHAVVPEATTCTTATDQLTSAGASAAEPDGTDSSHAVPPDISAAGEDDTPASARQRLEEVMAKVQELEDQGRLVEASALMVESMRLQASLAGR